jgi:rod shape-determining protein MreC
MTLKRQGHRVSLLLIGLLSGQMLLMSMQARHPTTGQSMLRAWTITVAAPFLSAMGNFFSDIDHVWHNYADLRRARQDNEVLRQQVAQLQLEVHRLTEVARLGERLQRLVHFQQSLPVPSVVAKIISRDISGWFQTVLINRGRADGVQQNSVVVTTDGLVGRVTALGLNAAQVQLITDERSGMGAVIGVLGQTRALGVVEGKNEALCKMRYVPGSEPVALDEIVYTTGQDGIYPKGIPIGRVIWVEKGSAMVSHDITVEPLARLSKLEEVVVLLSRPDTVELDSSVASGK